MFQLNTQMNLKMSCFLVAGNNVIVYLYQNFLFNISSHTRNFSGTLPDNIWTSYHQIFICNTHWFFIFILRWSRANKPTLRQIHTKMSGNYFHRGISRLRAEELLLSAGEDGCFLVRDSETLQGAYVLCLL